MQEGCDIGEDRESAGKRERGQREDRKHIAPRRDHQSLAERNGRWSSEPRESERNAAQREQRQRSDAEKARAPAERLSDRGAERHADYGREGHAAIDERQGPSAFGGLDAQRRIGAGGRHEGARRKGEQQSRDEQRHVAMRERGGE